MDEKQCDFCSKPSSYVCPRCMCQYCSLSCYQDQKHAECSETFYKEQVMAELKDMKGSPLEKQKLLQTLMKMSKPQEDQSEMDNVSDHLDDLSVRLSDVDLDDFDSVWNKLNEKEKRMFEKSVAQGEMKFIKLWKPWWESYTKPKIEDITSSNKVTSKVKVKLPASIKDLQPIEKLLGNKEPDSSVKYNIISSVFSYCFLMRLYNGDLLDSLPQSIDLLLSITPALSKTIVYNSTEESMCASLTSVQNDVSLAKSIDPVEVTLMDIKKILDSNTSLEALSDLHNILKKSRKFFKASNQTDCSKRVFLVMQKLYFFAAYARGFSEELQHMSSDLAEIRTRLLKERKLMDEGKVFIEDNMNKLKPKTLIEEIS